MKKTLIALMALAGSVVADDAIATDKFNTALDQMLLAAGYNDGDAFTLSFTIDTYTYSNGSLTQLDSNYYLNTVINPNSPSNARHAYVGLSYSGSDVSNIYNADGQASPSFVKPTSDTTTTPNTLTWDTDGYLYSWITTDPNNDSSQSKYLQKAVITISTDGSNSNITLAINNGPKSIVNLEGVVLNANDITLNSSLINSTHGTIAINGGSALQIPEPTTATLSLLALAGLAARRRRR